jgi:DNA-binding GntR family transcriptional regulator
MGIQFKDLSHSLSLKDRVYYSVRDQIINGTLAPGSRLLEEELSKAMHISRAPIREALNMLEKDGFTTIIPRKGAFVSTITKKDVEDIWEMRILLEPYAAIHSYRNIPDEEINAMMEKLNRILNITVEFDEYMNSDLELHELLYKYVDNKLLKDTLKTIKAHSLRIRYFAEHTQHTRRNVIEAVTKDHIDVIEALKSRDKKYIHESVYNHVVKSQERSLKAIDKVFSSSKDK